MKRFFKWLGYVVLALAAVAACLWYVVFGPNSPIVDGQQVAPGVETIKDGFVSVFVLAV